MLFKLSTWAALATLAAAIAAGPAQAVTVWDEAVAGDLSDDGLAPDTLAMAPGSNTVVGSAGDSGSGTDRDYFRFNVANGFVLTSLVLLPNTSTSGSSSFVALQAGPQVTVTPTGGGADALLGFVHYTNDQIGVNLLTAMALPPGTALSAGTYSVWAQETGGLAEYGFDFVISPVPEPGAAVLFGAGLLALALTRRR